MFFCYTVKHMREEGKSRVYLNMNMNNISNIENVATLSMVFTSTTSCLLRAGRNRTSFKTLSRRKVRSTDKPPSASPAISHTLRHTRTHNKHIIHTKSKQLIRNKQIVIYLNPGVALLNLQLFLVGIYVQVEEKPNNFSYVATKGRNWANSAANKDGITSVD